MKKFLGSVLKIGLGFFLAFILLGIVVAIISPDDAKESSSEVEAPAANVVATPTETPEPAATPEPVVTPEEKKSTSLDDAKVEEDDSTPKKSESSDEETPAETETEKSSSNEVAAPTESTQKTGGVYDVITWDFYKTKTIGSLYTAASGKNYYVVTIKFDNTGSDTYSTNAFFWKLKADGVSYVSDAATYSLPGYKLVDVGPGGKAEAQLAFLIDGEPTNVDLEYVGF